MCIRDRNKVTGEVDLKALQGAVDTDTRNTIQGSDTVEVDATNTNQDGSINYKLNVKTDGKVEKNNKGVINGGTVYKAVSYTHLARKRQRNSYYCR